MCCLPLRLLLHLLHITANVAHLALPCARRDALFSSVDKNAELELLVASGGRLNVGRALATLLRTPASPPQPPTQCACRRETCLAAWACCIPVQRSTDQPPTC